MTHEAPPLSVVGAPVQPASPLPLLVGVTGHRDVSKANEIRLGDAIGSVFDDLRRANPQTSLVLLSALAAGADVIAAEAALARSIPVIAVLPMPQGDYEADFSDAEAARFKEILSQCAGTVTLAQPAARTDAYINVGAYLATYSHILIACWDGLPSDKLGGTADVVRMRTTGVPSELSGGAAVHYTPDISPLFHIVTPRADGDDAQAFTIKRLYPARFESDRTASRDFEKALKNLNRCNRDIAARNGALQERLDAAAGHLQNRIYWLVILVYGVAFIAFSTQFVAAPGWLKFAMLALAYAGYLFARRFDYENRYQDYRALSEALRVADATRCAGLPPGFVESSYLGMQQSELQWIRMALRSAEISSPPTVADPAGNSVSCRNYAIGQRDWYKRATKKQAALSRRYTLTARIAMAIGLAITAIAFVVPLLQWYDALSCFRAHHGHACTQWTTSVERIAAFLDSLGLGTSRAGVPNGGPTAPIAIGTLSGVFLSSYAAKWGYAQNSKRYERMYLVFEGAAKLLEKAPAGSALERQLIADLARQALIEQADWLLSQRERPLSVPRG